MRLILSVALGLVFGTNAAADSAKDFVWASQMAAVIASADECGFKLDDAKVKALVEGKIAKLDTGTRANFQATLTTTPQEIAQLPSTAKKAQCAMQSAVAKREGLIQ